MLLDDRPDLVRRLHRLGWRESELVESFARSAGPGGQNVNKVATAVSLRHLPTNTSVTVQETRSQYRNRQLAAGRLVAILEAKVREQRSLDRAEREKARRRRSPRPPSLKRQIRVTKERRSEVKRGRRAMSAE